MVQSVLAVEVPEHILARVQVQPRTHKSLFISVVQNRRSTQSQQHRVGKQNPLAHVFVTAAGTRSPHKIRKPTLIVITDESGQLQRGVWPTLVEHIVRKHPCQKVRTTVPCDRLPHGDRKSKIEYRRQLVKSRVARQQGDIRCPREHLTEYMEVGDAPIMCASQHCRYESLQELRIHMLRSVKAETIHPVAVDPGTVDINESLNHARVFGHQ